MKLFKDSRGIRQNIFPFFMFLSVTAGCQENGVMGDGYEYSVTKHGIIHGHAAPDDPFNATVGIVVRIVGTDIREMYCSGVLVTPDTVLTAGHCVQPLKDEANPLNALWKQGMIQVMTGENIADAMPKSFYEIRDARVHELYDAGTFSHDIAIIRLKKEISDKDAVPLPLITDRTIVPELEHNRVEVIHIGYGIDEYGNSGRRMYVGNEIDCHCPADRQSCPTSSDELPVMPGGSFGFNHESDAGGQCQGDSGGPTLVQMGDGFHVAGICSFGDEACRYFSASTSVADHAGWIEETIRKTAPICEQASGCSPRPAVTVSQHALFFITWAYLGVAYLFRRRPWRR